MNSHNIWSNHLRLFIHQSNSVNSMYTNSGFNCHVEDIICVQAETSVQFTLIIYHQIEKQSIVLNLSEDKSLLWNWFYI